MKTKRGRFLKRSRQAFWPIDKPPVKPLADPRYKYVNPKGKAPKIHQLAGTWAADLEYGKKLENLLKRLYRSR